MDPSRWTKSTYPSLAGGACARALCIAALLSSVVSAFSSSLVGGGPVLLLSVGGSGSCSVSVSSSDSSSEFNPYSGWRAVSSVEA